MKPLDNSQNTIQELYANYPEMPYISSQRDLKEWLHSIQTGSRSLVPLRNMNRLEEGILPGSIILLWRINFETFTTKSIFPKYFEYTYGINANDALQELQEKGYARKVSASGSLTHLNAPQLKTILKEFAITGYSKMKKEDLLQLTREQVSENQLADQFDIRGYRITAEGTKLLEKYSEIIDRHPKKTMN
ncbi:hypothetical protein LZ578_03945 [Jeotgalibaca sp. MA1X17-3]|uniref:hypothetical protein n=1 Tax=Jeotgalibaca sp. MA1X17-3 TaxID=2908211 RepID=UPI001F1B6518|nr:hypothetical protein [Jeotgalibaca sp. MA1X17-3]UJF16290.1 hypothetical protein LZ578_03945 [Jeotgalibaca sp. MA1X17-3]